ncbi:MAG: FHA domain-containing protein [Phycisphaerales bacterium]|nr:MAG: FHA domain-containing protein [Phycisphaerales bacterium]
MSGMGKQHLHSMTEAFYAPDSQTFTSTSARLFGIAGPLAGASYALGTGVATVGRDPQSSVCIPSPGVSKTHCIIEQDAEGQYVIRDQGSRNGTSVNGRRLKPEVKLRLSHGDRIAICDSGFFFLHPKATAETVTPDELRVDFRAASREANDFLAGCSELKELRRRRRGR